MCHFTEVGFATHRSTGIGIAKYYFKEVDIATRSNYIQFDIATPFRLQAGILRLSKVELSKVAAAGGIAFFGCHPL